MPRDPQTLVASNQSRTSRAARKSFRLARTVALFLLTAAPSHHAAAQVRNPKLSQARVDALSAAITKFIATNKVPGLSAAVVEHGQFAWSQGFGFADVKNHTPATPQTLYRLASVSKPLTATGAMELWERGKLDLDAPIQKYCPAFPEKSAPITTRQLLGHLAGVRHYKNDSPDDPEIANTKHFADPISDGLKFFASDPLIAPPGTHFHYSTFGYTLVGCAIEGASGQKYVDYMLQNVFAPAGMNSTLVDDNTKTISGRTSFYAKDASGSVVAAAPLDSSYKIPAGGWLSSADDMARFEVATLNGKLLKPATIRLTWTRQKPSDGSEDEYGLGWGVDRQDGMFVVSHDGGQQGASTAVLIAPSRGDGIVVLANLEDVDAAGLATELLKILIATEPDKQEPMIEH